MDRLTRRDLLGGFAGASLGAGAWPAAAQVLASPRPRARPAPAEPPPPPDMMRSSAALIAEAGLSGQVAFALVDAGTGMPIAQRAPGRPMPPASVAKAVTAAYALDVLGPGHRFSTALLATGPLRDGRLTGDLVLAGGGAPGLTSDGLGRLVRDARKAGLREVTGSLLVWDGALPEIFEIDPEQPDHVGYNPSVSGLNLNFNRVHAEWRRAGDGYDLRLDARTQDVAPKVGVIDLSIAPRDRPIFTWSQGSDGAGEEWSVARAALGVSGARWLPVRDGGAYAGDVFRTLAGEQGIVLPPAAEVADLPRGAVLAADYSSPAGEIAQGMLRFSTNLTAEVLGLAATAARTGATPEDLPASAAEMNEWAQQALGMRAPAFVDHSGLGDASRVSPEDLVRGLVELGPGGPLRPILRKIALQDAAGRPEPLTLWAKTGTLNFVSALAGYISPASGTGMLAFAVMTADLGRRAAIPEGNEERPAGAAGWARRSRAMQYDLVRLWSQAI